MRRGCGVSEYAEFLARKGQRAQHVGPTIDADEVHPFLHEWQRRVVAWAVRAGRAALWADTGLGKTVMQIEWARLVAPGGRVLLVAPLAVCQQTVAEARKVDQDISYVRHDDEAEGPGVWVTNYEMTERFAAAGFDAVVLDESSILKDVTGKTRERLIRQFEDVPYRLACTATPAPNDVAELANHAEFLGRSTRREMLSTYFVHDQDGWRAKGHARAPMFAWMSSWAIALRRPSDIGGDDTGYDLPPLTIRSHRIDVDVDVPGQLFATDLGGVTGRAKIRRVTLEERCRRAADLVVAESDQPWLLWCGLNDEADRLAAMIPGAVNVHGSLDPDEKARLLLGFAGGEYPVLITKPSIAAFGLNLQRCARMAFVGLSDSYEAYYQALRRCWRYGQTRPVDAHIVLSTLEGQIAANVERKESEAARFAAELVASMRAAGHWETAAA